jgi:hypothetical protein
MSDRIILRREPQISQRMPGGWTRENWRAVARSLGVKTGRNTADTIANIKAYITDMKVNRGITVNTAWADYLRDA